MEDVKWSPEMEVALYKAMVDHKPVGCNKHWHMLCIQYHIVTQGGVVISISAIWEHLKLLYDLASLVNNLF
jgi:MRG-binding protein